MKKRIFIALALVCVFTCAFVLTACSEGMYNNPAWNMKGEEVTNEEWEAAFAEDNFTNVKMEITVFQVGKYVKKDGTTEDIDVTMKTTVIIADNVHYYKQTNTVNKGSQEVKDEANASAKEGYFTKGTAGYTVVYKDDDGKWATDTVFSSVAADMLARYLAYGTLRSGFKYDAEQYCYMADLSSESIEWEILKELSGVRLKFQGGKYAAFFNDVGISEAHTETNGNETTTTYEDIGRIVTAVVFTYGGQKLTVPTVA